MRSTISNFQTISINSMQATATKLSSIRKTRTHLKTYSIESMANFWGAIPELDELQ